MQLVQLLLLISKKGGVFNHFFLLVQKKQSKKKHSKKTFVYYYKKILQVSIIFLYLSFVKECFEFLFWKSLFFSIKRNLTD